MHEKLIGILRSMDIRILYFIVAVFVVPVCLVLNSGTPIIYRYFRTRWGLCWWRACIKTYKNFYCFGQVVADKFAMYAGKKFDVEIEGYEHFLALQSKPEGFIQLSAHIGNYEIAGYSLVAEKKKFNALVFAGEKESVMENRNKMFEGTNISMIGIRKDMSHLFKINDALSNGEIVSMPADRLLGSKKVIKMRFLRGEAEFPQGPFSVATMRSLDVLAVNVMKVSTKKYKIFVKPLVYDKEASRNTQIQQLAQGYIDELDRMLMMYPEQWYNYFEFWK
ncbi:MAG: lysophospholipid acyltransferase family protein [Bacteroidaceae bacterium]|nr:lysophospholipid acyltransferase family protein [Bacteroidaceae bacterium]